MSGYYTVQSRIAGGRKTWGIALENHIYSDIQEKGKSLKLYLIAAYMQYGQ